MRVNPADHSKEPTEFPHWLHSGTAVLDSDGRVLRMNDELAGWLGVAGAEGAELVGLLTERFPDWSDALEELFAESEPFGSRLLATEEGTLRRHFRIELARHEGTIFFRIGSRLPETGELAEGAWDESLHSRDAQREMFGRLIRAETRLDALMKQWPGVIFSQRADFGFHFVSPQIKELTGITPEQWLRSPQLFWQVVHDGDAEELRQAIKRSVLLRQPGATTFRIRHLRTGRVSYIMEQRQPQLTAGGLVLGYEGIWVDITRQCIAEKRLSSAAWKETLSLLTMGLAHDFRNLMAGINALSEQFLDQVDKDGEFHEGLTLIMENSRQATQLVQRLLSLQHDQVGERNYHDINQLVSEVMELARKIVPRRITTELHLAKEQLPVYLDAVEFRQALINLILNAVDAMPDRGRLCLRLERHEAPPDVRHLAGAMPRSPLIALSVADSGCGIREANLGSLFDPFFTTKPLNKGSGLGLYNARLFAERHQGAIAVESTEGTGATFQLLLPVADFTEGERDFAEDLSRRKCLLLLGREGKALDDTTEFLRLGGYHVVSALSRELATALIDSREYPFAGVLAIIGRGDHEFLDFMRTVNRGAARLKTILMIVGRNEDELETTFLQRADLTIDAGMSQSVIQQKLGALFAEP